MSILVIGPEQCRQINAAIERARARPIPLELLASVGFSDNRSELTLDQRKPGTDELRQRYPSQQVILGTYRAAVSFEEQPAGLMIHLSVSSHAKNKIPGLEVMQVVCEAFNISRFPPKPERGKVWMEEFERGHMAVNVVEIVEGQNK